MEIRTAENMIQEGNKLWEVQTAGTPAFLVSVIPSRPKPNRCERLNIEAEKHSYLSSMRRAWPSSARASPELPRSTKAELTLTSALQILISQ